MKRQLLYSLFLIYILVGPFINMQLGLRVFSGASPISTSPAIGQINADFENITISTVKKLMESLPDLIVIDVRTEDEFNEVHIEKAVLLPVSNLEDSSEQLEKDGEILVYCWSGRRSAVACRVLVEKGFENVYNMLGGLEAWKSAGYSSISSSEGYMTTEGRKTKIIDDQLQLIRDAIKKKGARWAAGETSVSSLPFDEKRLRFGAKFDVETEKTERLSIPPSVIPPGTFDWRNVDGVDWITPIKDQGACGSCWAFGTLGSMEAVINIVYEDPTMDLDLSEQTLVSCCLICGDCSGGYPLFAYDYIQGTGIPDEECFPYEASNVPCGLCPDWEERAWFITDYSFVSNDPTQIKGALQTYGPLGVAMYAPDDFLYYQSGVYEPVWASSEWNNTFPYGDINHWVTLVGYDDDGEYWIVKNSWGSGWGEEGYGKIAYGVLEEHNYILAIYAVEGPVAPEHNLVVSVEAPSYLVVEGDSLLNATVSNNGLYDEINVELSLLVNGTVLDYVTIPLLAEGESESISSAWSPTEEGWYNVTAFAPSVPGEDITSNNVATKWVFVKGADVNVLLVVDDDGGYSVDGTSRDEFETILTNAGVHYYVLVESTSGRPSLGFLNAFDIVVWTCGDYWNGAVDSVDADNIMSYVEQGGILLLEGEDIGFDHVVDDFMLNVAHALYMVDDSGAPGLTVTYPDHPVTQGLPSTFNWTIEPPFADGVVPFNGGYEVIRYTETEYTAVTVYEGSSDGSVVYLSFPLYCLPETEANQLVTNFIDWLSSAHTNFDVVAVGSSQASWSVGEDVVLQATIENTGDVTIPVGDATASFWVIDPTETHIVDGSDGNGITIDPGETYVFEGSWDSTGAEPGWYDIKVVVSVSDGTPLEKERTENDVFELVDGVCEITWFRVSPHWFSPNGDGRRDTTTIRATFSTTANWTLTIRPESAGDLIREWTGTGPSLNTAWNGTDGTGAVVPDGTYRVQLIIECAVGGDRKGRSTVVDNTPPTITDVIASPDPFDPSTETTDICYTLSKQCRVTIKIFSAETWTLKRTLIRMQEQSAGPNCEPWDGRDGSGAVVPLGVYLIKMFAWDRAGNRAIPPARGSVIVS